MIRMTCVAYSLCVLRWRSSDLNNAHSERREGTEPLGDPCGRPDADHGSRPPGPGPPALSQSSSSESPASRARALPTEKVEVQHAFALALSWRSGSRLLSNWTRP